MSVIVDVIQDESNRLSELISFFDRKIADLPKGSISRKPRRGHLYCYLAYWSGGGAKFKYIGRDGSDKVEEVAQMIQKRRKYESKRKNSKKNLAEVQKLLRAAGR